MDHVDRVVIVTKPTRYEELVKQHNTSVAAAFALESEGQSIEPYELEHGQTVQTIEKVHGQIPSDLAIAYVSRPDLPHFLFRNKDVIIVCGPDGLVVNTAQYIRDQVVIGVKTIPEQTGKLARSGAYGIRHALETIDANTAEIAALTMVQGRLGDKSVYGLNEIFLGRNDQMSALYTISYHDRQEHQSSSGVIVSTGTGGDAWIRSIQQMVRSLSYDTAPGDYKLDHEISPESRLLRFVVREAWPSANTGCKIISGLVTGQESLSLTCEMPQGGVIFSDGMVRQAIAWQAGTTARVTVADRHLNLYLG